MLRTVDSANVVVDCPQLSYTSKITYIKMDPRNSIRNGFANGAPPHSHFYAVWSSRHESSMIPKALKFATLQKKMAPIPPHT